MLYLKQENSMMTKDVLKAKKAQTAVEYLLLFTVVATVVLVSFKTFLPKTHDIANQYFIKVANGIMGPRP